MLVKIFKLEQRSPDYLRLNPLGKVLLNLLTGDCNYHKPSHGPGHATTRFPC